MEGPIYTRMFIVCEAGDEGAFRVHYPDTSGETDGADGHLREATLEEAIAAPTVYVEVKHELEWPYAAWDCEETEQYDRLFPGEEVEPRKFCLAAIVATPQQALI